jgi:hypothetical protein
MMEIWKYESISGWNYDNRGIEKSIEFRKIDGIYVENVLEPTGVLILLHFHESILPVAPSQACGNHAGLWEPFQWLVGTVPAWIQ